MHIKKGGTESHQQEKNKSSLEESKSSDDDGFSFSGLQYFN